MSRTFNIVNVRQSFDDATKHNLRDQDDDELHDCPIAYLLYKYGNSLIMWLYIPGGLAGYRERLLAKKYESFYSHSGRKFLRTISPDGPRCTRGFEEIVQTDT